MSNKKVLVIGIDGACWNVIDQLIEKGIMPNLKSIKENGVWGNLESSIPPVTFPAWRCYSTGLDPSQLKVYWWMNVNVKTKKFRINNSYSFKGKDLWNIIGEYGKKSIVINIPGTYPAKKINGILISGPISPEFEKAVYPTEIVSYLKSKGYKNFPESKWSIEKERVLDEVRKIHKIQSEIALHFLKNEDWDFFHFTFFLTDPIMHYFWKYWDITHPLYSENPFKSKMEEIWREVDSYIGKFIELLGEDSILIIMSDHGLTKLKSKIYLNRYLEEKGYLSIKTRYKIIRKVLSALPIPFIGNILSKVGILDFVYNILKKLGIKSIANTGVESQIDYNSIKWEDTIAFCLSDIYGLIYTTFSDQRIKKLIGDLKSLIDPVTGEFIFKEIFNPENVYEHIDDETPKLIAIPYDGYHFSPSLAGTKIFDYSYEPWSATHSQYGIFLAFGKDIRKNKNIECRIYDLAPTILHILDVPIPNCMKGKVLKEIFKESSDMYNKEIKYMNVEKKYILTKIKKLKSMEKL